MRKTVAAVIDTASVVVFSMFGRGAHAEGFSPGEVWSTAWPFLVGLMLGWSVLLGSRVEPRSVRAGLTMWAAVLVVGMTIWGVRKGEPPHWSFVLVAGTATALFLMGWRFVARRLERRRAV